MKSSPLSSSYCPLFVLAAVTLAVAALAACDQTRAATKGAPREAQTQEAGLSRVVTVAVSAEDLSASVTMPGSVMALESAELHARVGGYLERMQVDIGDEVEEGQVLAIISVPEMVPELRGRKAEVEYARSRVEQSAAAVSQSQAALTAAEAGLTGLESARAEQTAELAFRRSELARWSQLIEESPSIERRRLDEARYQAEGAQAALALADAGVLSGRARIEEARAGVRKAQADEKVAVARVGVAEASLDVTRELMLYAEIRAPYDGIITERHVHRGAFIRAATSNSAAMPLLRIQRVDRVRISVELPMDSIALLDAGDPVVFANIAAAPGALYEGSVTRISKALGERSRMMRAEVEFDNPPDAQGRRALLPGYYGDLTVRLEDFPGTPTVPASAVFMSEGEMCVFVLEGDVVRRRSIETIFRDGARVGVGGGLSVGQRVVASGVAELEDGQRVRAEPTRGGGR